MIDLSNLIIDSQEILVNAGLINSEAESPRGVIDGANKRFLVNNQISKVTSVIDDIGTAYEVDSFAGKTVNLKTAPASNRELEIRYTYSLANLDMVTKNAERAKSWLGNYLHSYSTIPNPVPSVWKDCVVLYASGQIMLEGNALQDVETNEITGREKIRLAQNLIKAWLKNNSNVTTTTQGVSL